MRENDLEDLIRNRWDNSNEEGKILYVAEKLTTRTLTHNDVTFYLIHNAVRDEYDNSVKSIDKPIDNKNPLRDGSNPILALTEDQQFQIMGNRFACMRYQSILIPKEKHDSITVDFLRESLLFARSYPKLTLLYNAIGAGKTVPHQYWLLSFHNYATLTLPENHYKQVCNVKDMSIYKRDLPCYMISFRIDGSLDNGVELLHNLIVFMNHINFNIFIFANRVHFIPRENIEIPSGFDNHRFGGLEMTGFFVMKSIDSLKSADPQILLNGIQQISYAPIHQRRFEDYLRDLNIFHIEV